MLRTMMKSKIHRATVTQADLHYVGYGQMDTAEAMDFRPSVVFVDAGNAILTTGSDPAETLGDPNLTRGDIISR